MSDAPLLACKGARIDVGGGVLVDGLDCESDAQRLGLVGAWSPLFALLGAEATLAAGSVEIAGTPAARATAQGVVGLARTASPLPPDWSVATFLEHSARLAGVTRKDARTRAEWAAETLGVPALLGRRIASLAPVEHRAALIAHGLLGAPLALAVETPLDDLDDAAQRALADLLLRAAAECRLIVSVGTAAPLGPARGLLDALDEVLVLEAGSLVAQGPPGHALAPGHRYLVSVSRHAAAFAEALAARGVELAVAAESGRLLPVVAPDLADAARLVVDLTADLGTDQLIALALELGAPVTELVPLASSSAPGS